MKQFQRFLVLATLGFLIQACSSLPTKVDPGLKNSTDSGFEFRFAMSGDWYPMNAPGGQYLIGQKPTTDGSTKLALVKHGPIYTAGGKAMSKSEIFAVFKRDIENEAHGGRVTEVKSTFSETKYKGADCLSFSQIGTDPSPQGSMNLINVGRICLHPEKAYRFIWMALSARSPKGSPLLDLSDDKTSFFGSLEFR